MLPEEFDSTLAALAKANGEIAWLKKVIKRQNVALAAASQKLKQMNPRSIGRVIQHVERTMKQAEKVV